MVEQVLLNFGKCGHWFSALRAAAMYHDSTLSPGVQFILFWRQCGVVACFVKRPCCALMHRLLSRNAETPLDSLLNNLSVSPKLAPFSSRVSFAFFGGEVMTQRSLPCLCGCWEIWQCLRSGLHQSTRSFQMKRRKNDREGCAHVGMNMEPCKILACSKRVCDALPARLKSP